MSESKFWKGVLLGAAIGGALSLLDRATRKAVIENCQETTGKITYAVKHPQETIDYVKDTTRKVQSTFEGVKEEVTFIAGKIDELKEVTPQVTEIIKDTKKSFEEKVKEEEDDVQPISTVGE